MKKKIALVIVICVVASLFAYLVPPAVSMKKTALPDYSKEVVKSEEGEELDITSGESLIAKSGDTELYFDPSLMKARVVDRKKGFEWASYMKGAEGDDAALLIVNYLGKDNNIYTWDSDKYCRAFSSYTVSKLDNGVKIVMDINEGEANRFFQYLPKKMSIEEYENTFVKGLDDAFSAGTITEDEHKRYATTLSLVYRKSITEKCYAVTYKGNPPTSATQQMIRLARVVGYTKEMLEADASEFDFHVDETEVAEFSITMYLVLEDGELVARVPSQLMESMNDYFTIQNVEVLPNFGAVTAKNMEDGYMLIPDGSGALMKMNTYKSGVPDYKRAVYNNDFYSDYYFASEYGEELMMPVFGMTYGKLESAKQGYFAIIEKGAEIANVNTKLAGSSADGATDNKIYASFDTDQYSRVRVNGPYNSDSPTYLVDTGLIPCDLTVRYMFYGRGVTYYDMAESYKNYIASHNDITLSYRDGKGSLYMDVLGALSVKKHIMGIPYNSTSSVTTYKELAKIMEDLAGTPLVIDYKGAFNGGMDNKVNNRAKLVGKNGSARDLDDLLKKAEEDGNKIYLDTTLSRVYKKGNAFRERSHALKDYSDNPATIYRYDSVFGYLSGYLDIKAQSYEILSPVYLKGVSDAFIKKSGKYKNLGISDLGELPYGDYNNTAKVDPVRAAGTVKDVFDKLKETRNLAISNAFMKYAPYADVISDVSRDSSEYATFAYTIPFRQLVLNGICDYTTENVNMSSKDEMYYILQAAELGSLPKFTVMNEKEDIFKNTSYDYLYCVNYDKLSETIKNVWSKCSDIYSKIGTNEITDHAIIEDGVYETTYKSGRKVIVNYNLTPVNVSGTGEIEAENYVILDENGDTVE